MRPINSSRRASFPVNGNHIRGHFWLFSRARELDQAASVSYRGTAPADKMPPSIRPFSAIAETLQMTLTVAHISPIISVIAGLLILIMPRLLNLVVAVFLILNGLIGLGLLRWLHL
jgi:ABC-type bacteriocin/lantibiotic exporter with double-glycine peptidase domain